MTALERALVVYAEAKGYEIEVEYRAGFWKNKQYEGKFDFGQCEYKIKQSRGFELGPVTVLRQLTDEITKITNPGFESRKSDYPKPAGFSCKTKMYTREEIEEMNKPKEKEFDVKAYVKSLVETPEYLERCKEVNPIIEILEAYKRGETIERKEKYSDYPWIKCEDMDILNPMDFVYRIAPKQPEAIQATEEELEEVKSEPKPCFWIKDKKTGITWKLTEMGIGVMQDFYIFDKQTKTWQDWGSK